MLYSIKELRRTNLNFIIKQDLLKSANEDRIINAFDAYLKELNKTKSSAIFKMVKENGFWNTTIYENCIPASKFASINLPTSTNEADGEVQYLLLGPQVLQMIDEGMTFTLTEENLIVSGPGVKVKLAYASSPEEVESQLAIYVELLDSPREEEGNFIEFTKDSEIFNLINAVGSSMDTVCILEQGSATLIESNLVYRKAFDYNKRKLVINPYLANKINSLLSVYSRVEFNVLDKIIIKAFMEGEEEPNVVLLSNNFSDTLDMDYITDEDINSITPKSGYKFDCSSLEFMGNIQSRSDIMRNLCIPEKFKIAESDGTMHLLAKASNSDTSLSDSTDDTSVHIAISKEDEVDMEDLDYEDYSNFIIDFHLKTLHTLLGNCDMTIMWEDSSDTSLLIKDNSNNQSLLIGKDL